MSRSTAFWIRPLIQLPNESLLHMPHIYNHDIVAKSRSSIIYLLQILLHGTSFCSWDLTQAITVSCAHNTIPTCSQHAIEDFMRNLSSSRNKHFKTCEFVGCIQAMRTLQITLVLSRCQCLTLSQAYKHKFNLNNL